uniref:Uncharacterized protein n=1 Tax=viral metagenome TaxID=1070528 RepID=A0A6C0I274_9ZZZZ
MYLISSIYFFYKIFEIFKNKNYNYIYLLCNIFG